MHRLLGTLATVLLIAASAGCALRDGPTTQATGPSPFLAGFDVGAVVTAINGAPDGPECPAVGGLGRASSSVGTVEWNTGSLTMACEDAGDGTATRRAWSTEVAAELTRLGATVGGTGSSDDVADEWFYRSGDIDGIATIAVFPGADGTQWVALRIVERR